MIYQSALTTSLYSQLLEEALANEAVAFFEGANGCAQSRTVKGLTYWYWTARTQAGSSKSLYLGPDNEATRALVKQLMDRKLMAKEAIVASKATTRAYIGAGGTQNQSGHFRAIAAMANVGLFQKGVVLIGSHAFLSIGNALGVAWQSKHLATTDIDVTRANGVALAIPDSRAVVTDIPATLKALDKGFFEVPHMDRKAPSVSLANNKMQVRVDFLTALRGENRTPVYFDDLRIAAMPLRFMDYLLGGSPMRGLVIGPYAIPVYLPDPARFALHKLIVSQARRNDEKAKAAKDIAQASELLIWFAENDEGAILQAIIDAHSVPGAIKRIGASLPLLGRTNGDMMNFLATRLEQYKLKGAD